MLLNPIGYYHELIDGLLARDLEIHPLSDLKSSSKPAIGLRHDIDNHPNVALHMARYLAMKGLPGSFYLLHSANYYTPQNISQIVYKMNVYGCEIGLHNDAWNYEKGPQQVTKELKYLRSLGAKVTGTVAHNSLSAYGAANYEVFKERVLLDRVSDLPLGELSMKKLGLSYEGTFSRSKTRLCLQAFSDYLSKEGDIQSEEWMYQFLVENPCCDYETYAQFWLIGADKWAVAIRGKLHWQVGLGKVLGLAETLPPTTISLIVIHPDYFMTKGISEDGTIMTPARPRRYPNLPEPIRKVGKTVIRIIRSSRKKLGKLRQSRIPLETKWENAQTNYVEWAHEPLPDYYLDEIIETGNKFSEYVGDPQRCLDIGCGNGIIGGKTYEEIGYSYLTKTRNSHVIGLDPLPLIASLPPWLDEFKQGIAEEIPYLDGEFDKIVIATSLDHVKDPAKCISECLRVLQPEGTLYIWTTYKDYTDKYHPHGHQEKDLAHLLSSNGFKITDHRKVAHNNQFFLKAQKAPEFDHQWSDIPSPAIELNQDRIIEFLKFTKLPPSFFKGKHCLDVGCGSGRFTWAMQQLGAKVSSFDISPKAIERCSEINPDAYVQDIYDLEPSPIHDFVLCWGVLHHLPTPEIGFQKISTQVAKGGVLHIMVYHKDTQKIYEKGRAQWPSLSHEKRIKLCEDMIKRHGGNLHGWWDAFNPTYNFSYTPKEVRSWFEREGFTEITVTQEKNINIRGVKK